MKTRWVCLMVAAFLLVGCAGPPPEGPSEPSAATRTAVPSATAPVPRVPTETASGEMETQIDEQGSVVFEVTPVNVPSAGETLEFEVIMNTHSVDLSWDLASQSVLRTDDGLEVQGISWPVGNGHHYSGTLTFPAKTEAGDALLDGATLLSLVIRDTDVPERVFTWQLAP